MRSPWLPLAVALVASSWGCSPRATQAQLRDTAARDFRCPTDNLRYRTLDERSRWVAGCGKSATYKEECSRSDSGEERCGWKKIDDGASGE